MDKIIELLTLYDDELGQVRVISKNNNVQYLVINGEKIDKFKLLVLASISSKQSKETALQILNLASELFHPQNDPVFNELYNVVALRVNQNILNSD
jgi:hypothetical protein